MLWDCTEPGDRYGYTADFVTMICAYCKLYISHYRSGQALRAPEVENPRISRQQKHEGGKVVSPTHRPPLPPRRYSRIYAFLLEAESTTEPSRGRKDGLFVRLNVFTLV